MLKKIVNNINRLLTKHDLKDFKSRAHKLSVISMIYSFTASTVKILLAFYLSSYFLIASSIYSMTVGLTTRVYYRGVEKAFLEPSKEKKYTIMIYIGLFFCSFIYALYMIRLFFYEVTEFQFGVFSSLGIAIVAFTEVGVAVNGLIKSNRMKDSLLTARKTISLIGGLIAVVLTQSAVLAYITHNGTGHQKYNAMLGLLIGLIAMITSIVMLTKTTKKTQITV